MKKKRAVDLWTLPLWDVAIRDKATNEVLHIKVFAPTNEEATRKLADIVCYGAAYRWIGTGPA